MQDFPGDNFLRIPLHKRYCVVLILALLLSGCGFHLRGRATLPPGLSAVFVEQQRAPLISEALHRVFTEQSLPLVADKAQAQVVITVSNEQYTRRVLSVGASGKVQEYELHYAVDFAFLDANGTSLTPRKTLSIRRELRYDSNQVLAKAGEEQQLKTEMAADAAQQVIRRLQFIEPVQKPEQKPQGPKPQGPKPQENNTSQ